MSQTLIPITPSENAKTTVNTVADIVTTIQVFLEVIEEVTKPITIKKGKLQVNEKMLERNQIYSVTYNNQEYFIRRQKNATEIFQLVD